jgi:phospholipase C
MLCLLGRKKIFILFLVQKLIQFFISKKKQNNQTENELMLKLNGLLSYFLCGLLFCSFSLSAKSHSHKHHDPAKRFRTKTPIKYVVIIYPENRSFDHFFGTYPIALNPPGEPRFEAKPNTPTVNGFSPGLLAHNNNLIPPFRVNRSEGATCSPAHDYTPLQQDLHGGLMDQYIQVNPHCSVAMSYFDGNTVTALWNYAQRFAMSDNFHSTTLTPSAPGHLNLISGQTHGAIPPNLTTNEGEIVTIDGTFISDFDPAFDQCSQSPVVQLTGKNIGDLLNAKNITWGWFQGGFRDCQQSHIGSNGRLQTDYIPHHEPFQYYASTSNPQHLPPSSRSLIGFQDQANHQYDIEDFWIAAKKHNVPAVSFIKPPGYQDCHPGYSDPLAFQTFLVKTINRLQKLPEWHEMAIFIAFDDSGGFYDHEMPPIINDSQTVADALLGAGNAGSNPPFGGYQARLAYGLRLPFIIISPFAKSNYVDHMLIDQTSILRFIEDNWKLGRIGDFSFDELAGSLLGCFDFANPNFTPLILNPQTGLVKKKKKSATSFSSNRGLRK